MMARATGLTPSSAPISGAVAATARSWGFVVTAAVLALTWGVAQPFAVGQANATWFILLLMSMGLGGGLFSVGTMTAVMELSQDGNSGIALGAWGAVQATTAGVGLSVMLGAALMGLVFLSSGSGHDEAIEDPFEDDPDMNHDR